MNQIEDDFEITGDQIDNVAATSYDQLCELLKEMGTKLNISLQLGEGPSKMLGLQP